MLPEAFLSGAGEESMRLYDRVCMSAKTWRLLATGLSPVLRTERRRKQNGRSLSKVIPMQLRGLGLLMKPLHSHLGRMRLPFRSMIMRMDSHQKQSCKLNNPDWFSEHWLLLHGQEKPVPAGLWKVKEGYTDQTPCLLFWRCQWQKRICH